MNVASSNDHMSVKNSGGLYTHMIKGLNFTSILLDGEQGGAELGIPTLRRLRFKAAKPSYLASCCLSVPSALPNGAELAHTDMQGQSTQGAREGARRRLLPVPLTEESAHTFFLVII